MKTSVDRAAEGWVAGFLRGEFPEASLLCEEEYDANPSWKPTSAFWTVDALDGTRSFIEGYDGFCVQVALVVDGVPIVGVVYEPVRDVTYAAVRGSGAFRATGELWSPLERRVLSEWPTLPRFVDSTPPDNPIGALMTKYAGTFVECGSIGLKACRVVESAADIYVKRLRFKVWDVAPAQVLAAETGCELGLWDGSPVPYDSETIAFQDVLCAPSGLFERIATELA